MSLNPISAFTDVPLPEEALARFFAEWQLEPQRELVALDSALGRCLFEDVRAPGDLPAFVRSTVDGYAVRAVDVAGASRAAPIVLRVIGEVPMGQEPQVAVLPGTAVKIHTGAMLPPGADGVIMVEWTSLRDDHHVIVTQRIASGGNSIARGEDVVAGQLLLTKGRRLRPDDIGGLAAIGLAQVPVARRPLVALISSGDELVPAYREPGPAEVRDINGALLAALVQEAGCIPWHLGISRDDPVQFRQLVHTALASADAVIVSGGSSVGTRDLTRAILEELPDSRIVVHGVAVRPGKPTLLAYVGKHPFFGLPGNPVSAFATFRLFVRPALGRFLGSMEEQRFTVRARLKRPIPPSDGREDYVQVRVFEDIGEIVAEPVLGKSNLIFTVVRANGVVRMPATVKGIPEGQMVDVWPY
ncbi:MAG: molybdopterin molybdotransferase MoeA [Chloroflexi bacterium]|nr:molybdopterin molybdotransferase MoeA [Chloroflexota bacterium]